MQKPGLANYLQTPRYADIFNEIVWPLIKKQDRRKNWDSNSRTTIFEPATAEKTHNTQAYESVENCREACLSDPTCLQFSFRSGWCGISKYARLGYETHEDVTSEWMLDRIENFQREHSGCGVKWTFSDV
jgi:hypothetical protein